MLRRPAALLAVVFVLTSAGAARAADASFADYNAFYRAFQAWGPDSSSVAEVSSLLLERDAGTFALEHGRLALATPFGGRRVAAVFTGRGTMTFMPRSEIERPQLRRFFGSTTLRKTFTRLTLVFSDSTLRELTETLHFHSDTLASLGRAWRGTMPFLTSQGLHIVRSISIAQMLLDGDDNGLFWAAAGDAGGDPLFFALDPNSTERVQLSRRPTDDRYGLVDFHNSEIVSEFFAAGDPDTIRRDEVPAYGASHVALDVTVAPDLRITAIAALDMTAHGRPRAWLAFDLPDDLHLDGVTFGDRPQSFFQENDDPLVWVRLDRAIAPESTATVTFRYHGRCFDREDERVVHRFTMSWYPAPVFSADATWDMAFHYPRDLQLVAAGDRVATAERGLTLDSRWHVTTPVPWASFDLDYLRGTHVSGDSVPPVTVWMEHLDGAGRVAATPLASLRDAGDYDRRVARDVAHCLQFFQRELGPPQATAFNAVETPLRFYIAFPGLVRMMPREDKEQPGPEHTPDVIRAHEISHQWFGLGVRPATYHDMWLAEGFADFCSIWYLQEARRDTKSYLDVLGAWRTELLENRKFLLGAGQQAGPIWLGPRTNSSATPNDYDLVVYDKGAWVLHMLRNMLLEPNDSTESRFRGLLRDFYGRFRGQRAFTEDFRAAVERAAGQDMGWFFDQWVYGTDVPTYRFSWSAEPLKDGTWSIHGKVEQSNVPDTFKMPVFVRAVFGREGYSRDRVWVHGPVTEFTLPPSPRKPTDVVFNDLQSVLCDQR